MTRSTSTVPVDDETVAGDLEDMVKAAKRGMNKCSFHIAHSNSQSINGLSEANTAAAKKILKSLIGSIQQSSVPYPSFVSVISTFERVAGLLNSRPIFHNETSVMSVKHLMFPSASMDSGLSEIDNELVIPLTVKQTNAAPTDPQDIMSLIANSDQTHAEFCRLFIQSVNDSSFQRFGKKVTRKKNTFQVEDFVVVLVAAGAKYGIISQVVSMHTVNVRLLNKNKKIKSVTKIQSFSTEQVTLLHRKV